MTERAAYRDANLSTEERVDDLLARMTLQEKIGQLTQIHTQDDPEPWLRERHVGSFLFVLGEEANRLQKIAEQSRLGIPVIFGIDAIHGHGFWPGATVFPTQLALSCSWDPELVEEAGRVTAKEVRPTGPHWTFSPVCGTVRDLRWGRVDETFGEDPYLNGVLAAALVRGYQGEERSDPERILACAKHYAGYSETEGGRDASEANLSQRRLLSCFLPPFRAAVEAGCATIMTAYQAIDGVPATADHWLMTEVLRDQWGFEGFVVTDYDNVGRMHWQQKVCPTMEDAAAAAVQAGNDMMMGTPDFYAAGLDAVSEGRLAEADVDRACRRVLRMKFEMGLFDEHRYADLEKADRVCGCAEHRQFAREAARRTMVLLKNEGDLLPLGDELKRVAVIGPNADNPEAQLGDWSTGCTPNHPETHPRETVVTPLDGLRARLESDCTVEYARGCAVREPEDEDIAAAVEVARRAEVAIVVLGDDTSLNGEQRDRATLELTGAQERLLREVHATGTPTVLVLISGKPLCINWAAENVPAIIAAHNPGMEGGNALADLLFGDCNPCGKLTVSWPRHVGQQPVFYNQVPGWHTDHYADMTAEPLFPFGHGLSYTRYEYHEPKVDPVELRPGETLAVEVDVENTGSRAGIEIVQLYVNDLYSSVTTPQRELKAFSRVELEAGERKTVRLEVPVERLALVNPDLERVVEPGEFELMIGPSSRDDDLHKIQFRVVE
ncbi:MAG: glycoside hydrolase family 3 N-terminal domain-containing protein [Candidatus Brocadiia bacterium]